MVCVSMYLMVSMVDVEIFSIYKSHIYLTVSQGFDWILDVK